MADPYSTATSSGSRSSPVVASSSGMSSATLFAVFGFWPFISAETRILLIFAPYFLGLGQAWVRKL